MPQAEWHQPDQVESATPRQQGLTSLAAGCSTQHLPCRSSIAAWRNNLTISNVVPLLASDEARYVTGTELEIDVGYTIEQRRG